MLFYIYYLFKKLSFLQRHEITDNIHLPAFERKDYKNWNKFYFYLGAILLLPIRCFLMIIIFTFACIFCILIYLLFCRCKKNAKPSKAYVKIVSFFSRVFSRLILFTFGFYWISHKEIIPNEEDTRYFYDYGENRYSTIISNHVNFTDPFYFLSSAFESCFISNIKVKDIFVIGFLSKVLQTIFVDRSSSESKLKCIEDLKERVKIVKKNPECKYTFFFLL